MHDCQGRGQRLGKGSQVIDSVRGYRFVIHEVGLAKGFLDKYITLI